jgi:hypothetical protein
MRAVSETVLNAGTARCIAASLRAGSSGSYTTDIGPPRLDFAEVIATGKKETL